MDRARGEVSQETREALQVRAAKDWATTITRAVPAPPTDPRETAVREFCDELSELLVAKQRAYGPHAIAGAPGGPLNGLRVRLFDKHARFQNLATNPVAGDGVTDEALDDTAMDLAGYAVIAALVLRGKW